MAARITTDATTPLRTASFDVDVVERRSTAPLVPVLPARQVLAEGQARVKIAPRLRRWSPRPGGMVIECQLVPPLVERRSNPPEIPMPPARQVLAEGQVIVLMRPPLANGMVIECQLVPPLVERRSAAPLASSPPTQHVVPDGQVMVRISPPTPSGWATRWNDDGLAALTRAIGDGVSTDRNALVRSIKAT